eukprot:CAMPEP_0175075450 /NCGR_PEP_ID=MMETSP0052_2-20121109/22011_1 /TAXON_ID=51329 ORGANISM="Polytomella parva, Strain SAG 63-3" /NCGR_SAMPLE_ID=MMETSP0052_2 /ASSEMBLY_ACC=CAM_ASM_000194 /LENGTH=262 /DNA_ID=CAMNT_0016344145 /DNA_START=95 /DNA_END=883 /DNA_ORIENTATION=-
MAPEAKSDRPLTLISFDVDGTLIESVGEKSNYLHKQAFRVGMKNVFNIDEDIDCIKHHGSTDPLILIKVLEYSGFKREEILSKLKDVEAEMVNYFLSHKDEASVGLRMLPGVKNLLQHLKSLEDVETCLVTGNFEPIGWAKMQELGIYDYFSDPHFGGFGSDHCSGDTIDTWKDRSEFIRIAARKCERLHGRPVTRHFHVGDATADMLAALNAEATPLGVTTGAFTKEQLEGCGEGVIIVGNLADTDRISNVLGVAAPAKAM